MISYSQPFLEVGLFVNSCSHQQEHKECPCYPETNLLQHAPHSAPCWALRPQNESVGIVQALSIPAATLQPSMNPPRAATHLMKSAPLFSDILSPIPLPIDRR
jgi:hypothetical protein